MMSRGGEFSSPLVALLAGIAIDPELRPVFERDLDDVLPRNESGIAQVSGEEIIVGGGLHAAIYAMNRPKNPRPLILEKEACVGGILAQARAPFFYLNSRDRPTFRALSYPILPGKSLPLNMLPGAVLQTADIGGLDYLTQDDLGFVIRTNLTLAGRVIQRTVREIVKTVDQPGYNVLTEGPAFFTQRVILATGLGDSNPCLPGCITFTNFMKNASLSFPLRGFKKVAVVGAKESGNVTVEYLLGMGPRPGNSVTNLDYVERIDWFGQTSLTAEEFERCNRKRYKDIAREMPNLNNNSGRVQAFPGRVITASRTDSKTELCLLSPEGALRNMGGYDVVIFATGFTEKEIAMDLGTPEPFQLGGGQGFVATKYPDEEVYRIGPCANLPLTNAEAAATKGLPDNAAAVWRYAERTARLARRIGTQSKFEEIRRRING